MLRRPPARTGELLALALAAAAFAGCAGGGPAEEPALEPVARTALAEPASLLGPVPTTAPGHGSLGRALAAQSRAARRVPGAEVEAGASALRVRLPADLLFEPGHSALLPAARGRLRGLAALLKAHPGTRILVAAHEDAAGEEVQSLERTVARAEAVRAALVAEGVEAERMVALGLGGALPLAPSATPEGRQRNRRVEIEIRPEAPPRAAGRGGGRG